MITILCMMVPALADNRLILREQEFAKRMQQAHVLDGISKHIKNNGAVYAAGAYQNQSSTVLTMKKQIATKIAVPTNTACWHAIVAKVNKYAGTPEQKAAYAQRLYMQLATLEKNSAGTYVAQKGS